MMSVVVLTLECINLHFIDAGVKINCQYYLMQKLLPDIKEFSDYFSFKQDSSFSTCTPCKRDGQSAQAPETRLHPADNVARAHVSTWSITRYAALFSNEFTAGKCKMWMICSSVSLRMGAPRPACDQQRSQTRVLMSLFLCGCKGRTFAMMCESDSIFFNFHFCQLWYSWYNFKVYLLHFAASSNF